MEIYVGPHVKVPFKTVEQENEVSGCKACNDDFPHYDFCPHCGQKLANYKKVEMVACSTIVKKTLTPERSALLEICARFANTRRARPALLEICASYGEHEYDYFGVSQIPRHPDLNSCVRDSDCLPYIQSISPDRITHELNLFNLHYASEIEIIKTIYGSEVEVVWGVLVDN